MASDPQIYCYDGENSFTLLKWKVRVGSQLFYNSVILSYKVDGIISTNSKDPLLKYKSNLSGTIVELLAFEGDIVKPGAQLLKVQPCTHPVIMKDLCAECGADLRHLDRDKFEKLTAAATFSMVHVVPELKVCLEQAEKLGRDDENRLLKSRKLVLLVDLDQTLIHTTNDNVLNDLPDVHHFQLYGSNSPWYHTKLRPGTKNFLEKISKFYELHICTFGARLYAHKIAQILDPDGKFFSHRILSRDECFDATSKTGNLKALFPRGDDMVCIIDDREDVWNFAPNVVHVKPYCYFLNTGDINAPPFSTASMNTKDNLTVIFENSDTVQTKSSIKVDLCKAVQDMTPVKSKVKQKIKSSNENDNVTENTEKEKLVESAQLDSAVKNDEEMSCIVASEENEFKNKTNGKISSIQSEENNSQTTEILQNIKGKCDALSDYHDDYLLYLEEILENIHKKYYKVYDKMKNEGKNNIPDLKAIVPELRNKILTGCNIVFSSVIPTNLVPETSRFWTLAESLGAQVTLELIVDKSKKKTTHVVGSKLGTAKVNAAKRHKNIFVVSVDWLFSCAERWERIDERLFPLIKDITPPFLDGNRSYEKKIENNFYDPVTGKSLKALGKSKRSHNSMRKKTQKSTTDEEKFFERIFVEAGLSLSQDDIDDMDREIEEACSGNSENESQNTSSSESSSEESLSSEYPKGWKRPRKNMTETEVSYDNEESSDAETIGSVDEEMAEAVKQEFGS